jgi:hypothetical protein
MVSQTVVVMIVGLIVSALSFIQGCALKFNWAPAQMNFHAWAQIILSIVNVFASFIFYTMVAYALGPVTALAAIPFGFVLYYGCASMFFYENSAARSELAANAYFTNFAFSAMMVLLYMIQGLDIPLLRFYNKTVAL